jgi:hypothetical protein
VPRAGWLVEPCSKVNDDGGMTRGASRQAPVGLAGDSGGLYLAGGRANTNTVGDPLPPNVRDPPPEVTATYCRSFTA